MDLSWGPLDRAEAAFDDRASAYAHYWLSLLPADAGPLRGTADLAGQLRVEVRDLIERAFAPP